VIERGPLLDLPGPYPFTIGARALHREKGVTVWNAGVTRTLQFFPISAMPTSGGRPSSCADPSVAVVAMVEGQALNGRRAAPLPGGAVKPAAQGSTMAGNSALCVGRATQHSSRCSQLLQKKILTIYCHDDYIAS
jgi:hypothetical protein